MRRGLLLGASAVALVFGSTVPAQAGDAQITAEQSVDPRVIELTLSTPAFTAPTKVTVNLPVGYDADRARRWPVTYFLAGTMNTHSTFNDVVDGVELTESFPSIVVSPNGDSGYWSDWYNGGAFGPPMYETYVIDQLIPLIDARFRTIDDRSQRAVMGTSMGGYGAMMVAARHPDLFAAAASLSGAVDSNLAANGAVLSLSPTFQGAQADAIYGPRSTQEVRWRGHNPTDLADNLRDLDLQVRSANGVLNPAIGENPLSADSVSCVVEAGVYMASVNLHDTLAELQIPHLWQDYGAGCHSVPNFKREITDTLRVFTAVFAQPPAPPARFAYASIESDFDVWGWHVGADPKRPIEFLQLRRVSSRGLTAIGSGTATVTTPPLFEGLRRVDLDDAEEAMAVPDANGRISFSVNLGAPNAEQQFHPGAATSRTSRAVSFRPLARIKIDRVRATRRRVRICARALGGPVAARMRLVDARQLAATRRARLTLGSNAVCRALSWTRRPHGRRGAVRITGKDRFGHRVSGLRKVRLPATPDS
jgi:S-formylglutathione hydrolase FrmB